jgi:flagellar M-ring protein FliF
MSFISSLASQFVQLFDSLPGARKAMLLLILAGAIVTMGWLIARASTGGWTAVLSQSDMSQTGAAMSKLSQAKIPAKLDNNGSTLLVAGNRQDEAVMLLAMDGIYDHGSNVGNELLDRNSFGDSKFKQEKNYLRAREGELARTLMSLNEVEEARVHLALPDEELFVKDQKQPKASVVLKLRSGARLSDRQVNGIVNLVSHSVESLQPENVSVIDNEGNLISQRATTDFANATSENVAFKVQAEDRLGQEIQTMLERSIGKDKVIASVQMAYDFSSQKRVETIYNPNDQDPIVETEKTTVEEQNSPAGGGPAMAAGGSSASLAGASASASTARQGGRAGTLRNDSTKSYVVSHSVQETALDAPTLKRITVGVMVDGLYDESKGADGKMQRTFKPRSTEEMAQFEKIVKAVIGFDGETRGDVVEVTCAPFQTEGVEVATKTWLTPELRRMVEIGIQWGVVGLVSLLLIFMVVKPVVHSITVAPVRDHRALLPGREGVRALPSGEARGTRGTGGGAQGPRKVGATYDDSHLMELQESNKVTSEASTRVFREIQTEARGNPERTVGLIRQWMEEG